MRLQLDAVPHAREAVEEVFQIAGEAALSAVGEYLDDLISDADDREALSQSTSTEVHGARRAPMRWETVQRHWAELSGTPSSDDPRRRPSTFGSGAAMTVANVAWRLANDPLVRAHLRGARVCDFVGPSEYGDLSEADQRRELSELSLAITACTILGDAVRDMRLDLMRQTKKPWHDSSNSKILLALYQGEKGIRLNLGEVRFRVGESRAPRPRRRGSPDMKNVRPYAGSARNALSRLVVEQVTAWCPADRQVMTPAALMYRGRHYAGGALVQIWIWLGAQEKPRHGRDDTPW